MTDLCVVVEVAVEGRRSSLLKAETKGQALLLMVEVRR